MKKILYVGINSPGSTSGMRASKIKEILHDYEVEIIDTDIPTLSRSWIWRSIGFRYKIGPVVTAVNKYILDNLKSACYDLIWVDKAIYITEDTTKILRERTKKLVHYTPDPAFTFHRSKHFFNSLAYYDYAITTKSYEIDDYVIALKDKDKVIYATQGFDRSLHRPVCDFTKKCGICFIGHWEKEREETISSLLNAGIDVKLAGIKWDSFVKKNNLPNLHYLGEGVFGEEYVKAISSSMFALGSVSKWIPEKHTTRTFEIPACGTALVTEWNEELAGFFNERQVVYYDNNKDLVEKLNFFIRNLDELQALTDNGYKRVTEGGFDYKSIIENILKRILS